MGLGGYIRYLHDLGTRSPSVGDVPKYLLRPFIYNKQVSTYACYKFMNSDGKKISYKNVHKRIKKLHSLGLIERLDRSENNKHAAIFYKLSSFGVYFSIRNYLAGIELLSNHSRNPLFDIILYRFISKKTLQKIRGVQTVVRINQYLQRSCEIIEDQLNLFEKLEKSGGAIDLICRWDEILDPLNPGRKSFLNFLKSNCIKWLDRNADIAEQEKNVIRISSGKYILHLKVIDTKAILYDGKQKIHEFDVAHGYHAGLCFGRLVPPLVGIGHWKRFDLKSEALGLIRDIEDKVIEKAFELCFALINFYNTGSVDENDREEALEDYKYLAADENFRDLFETTGSQFETYRRKFIELGEETPIRAT